MQGLTHIKYLLTNSSGDEFQELFVSLVSALDADMAASRRLGGYDRAGIDAFIYDSTSLAIRIAIQCKGFEKREFTDDQLRQCVKEIEKYAQKGFPVAEYWLVLNRDLKEPQHREKIRQALSELERTGKVGRSVLLDRARLMAKLEALAAETLARWARNGRNELIAYYRERLEAVGYIQDVPVRSGMGSSNPSELVIGAINEFFQSIPSDTAGPNRHAPRFLISSSFGFGKTSTLHAIAQRWADNESHALYIPAALLSNDAFARAASLAEALLAVLHPDDVETTDLVRLLLRDTLRKLLAKSTHWILLIDGLDENPSAFDAGKLTALWGGIRTFGVPVVVSARDELVDLRPAEFSRDPGDPLSRGTTFFNRLQLTDWPQPLVLKFVENFAREKPVQEHEALDSFVNVVREGRYEQVYGDIPKRPLFLAMLAEDAFAGKSPERELHRLYGSYFRLKFQLDRSSQAARGAETRPSKMIDRLGHDETAERVIIVMQKVALHLRMQLEQNIGRAGAPEGSHADAIGESELLRIAAEIGISELQLEELAMHSLLQPRGRTPITRERVLGFAHKSYEEWFLARAWAHEPATRAIDVPDGVSRFLIPMMADTAAGLSLP